MRHSLSHPLPQPAPWPRSSRALQSTAQVVSSLTSPTACSSQLNNLQQHPEKTMSWNWKDRGCSSICLQMTTLHNTPTVFIYC